MNRTLRLLTVFALGIASTPANLRAAGPRTSAPEVRLIVIGDSMAYGAGDESGRGGIAGRLGARNAGINGARTWNVLALLKQPAMQTSLATANGVVLSIGGNDLYGDTLARWFMALTPALAMQATMLRVAWVVRGIEEANPRLRIYLLGIYDPYRRRDLDVRVAEWNAMLLERFAADSHVTVVPIADLFSNAGRLSPLDHFHPSADAYTRITRRIEDDF